MKGNLGSLGNSVSGTSDSSLATAPARSCSRSCV